jgi:hypothetical protein
MVNPPIKKMVEESRKLIEDDRKLAGGVRGGILSPPPLSLS